MMVTGMVTNMTTKTFFANFGYLVDAPNGVKKLRELILMLAVQGKLVPQDRDDEPAGKLLERIRAERGRLVKEKKIKTMEPLPKVAVDEAPYEVPGGWEWVRLGEICNQITDGTHHTPQYVPDGIPFLSVKDVSQGQIDLRNTRFISVDEHKTLIKRCNPEYEDMLFTKVGTTGIAKVIDIKTKFSIFVSLALIKFTKEFIQPFFLEKLLNSPLVKAQSKKYTQGVGNKNLVLKFIFAFTIPLPPFPEQHRIVAKVDQLMALCDELETRQQKKKQKLLTLNNAALDRLLTAHTTDDFADAWGLIRDNFDFLYTTPETITKLRQAILQLAVQGKLVTQDPNDEPASVLLEKIKVEKEQLVKEKKIKKSEPLPSVNPDEAPFELPGGWEWTSLGNAVLKLTDGTHHSPPNSTSGDFMYVTAKNIKNYGIDLDDITYITSDIHEGIYSRCNPEKGDILYIKDGATTGIATINQLEESFSMLSSVALMKLPHNIHNKFMLYVLRAPFFYDIMREGMSGVAITRVTLTKLNNAVIPLPPLPEQHRIVAKVDQLMKLCNELEAKLIQSQTKSEKLVEAMVQAMSVC